MCCLRTLSLTFISVRCLQSCKILEISNTLMLLLSFVDVSKAVSTKAVGKSTNNKAVSEEG